MVLHKNNFQFLPQLFLSSISGNHPVWQRQNTLPHTMATAGSQNSFLTINNNVNKM